jgi:hypothetical protein
MIQDSRSAVIAYRRDDDQHDGRGGVRLKTVEEAPSWKNTSTISTVSTAALAATLLLFAPEIGVGAIIGGAALGAVSAAFALTRPRMARR